MRGNRRTNTGGWGVVSQSRNRTGDPRADGGTPTYEYHQRRNCLVYVFRLPFSLLTEHPCFMTSSAMFSVRTTPLSQVCLECSAKDDTSSAATTRMGRYLQLLLSGTSSQNHCAWKPPVPEHISGSVGDTSKSVVVDSTGHATQ